MILNKLTVEQQTMVQCIDDDQSQEVVRRDCTTLVIPALDIEKDIYCFCGGESTSNQEKQVRWCSWLSRQSNIVSSLKVSSSSLGRIILFANCLQSNQLVRILLTVDPSAPRSKFFAALYVDKALLAGGTV
jgi:hypothetical protein